MINRKILIALVLLFIFTPQSKSSELPSLYKKLLPSVVTLHTFENKTRQNITQVATTPNGLGSGVIISSDGLIVTAAHVVHTADALKVEFSSGEIVPAKVVSSIPSADLALVKAERIPTGASLAKLGNSKKVETGESVFVIGAPLGINRTLTVGYISGVHPVGSRPTAPMAEFFQTDAAINPGNSGGPLFNMAGEIIGIASHIQTQTGGFQGLGFTVTSESVKQLLLNRAHFWSGIEFLTLNKELASIFHLPQSSGLLVQKVASGSFAQQLGLQGGKFKSTIEGKDVMLGGDIILRVNGNAFDNRGAIVNILNSIKKLKPGSDFKLTVWRAGKKKVLKYKIPY